ncbi:MAG: cytochrome c [Verrucomicrobiales bacterium]|nr:cytochrome c [Verrucomicrobiales bacterium]
MKPLRYGVIALCFSTLLSLISCATSTDERSQPSSDQKSATVETAQVPTWSRQDLDFFLHGSMSTEFAPESVLRAFMRTYPDLFPTQDLSHFGLIPDPAFGWPIGFSRKQVPHLAGLTAVGVNCAGCHVTEIHHGTGQLPIRVLGVTSHFDAEAFFGAVLVSTFRTSDPENMKRFLGQYLVESEGSGGDQAQWLFASAWLQQEQKIKAALADDPFGAKDVAPGVLHQIRAEDVRLNRELLAKGTDLGARARTMVKLFHNMRAALHVPDQPPDKAPPASGPGRNDAFGLLSAVLFGAPQPYAPVKYGLVWNLENRPWVHWDGNTRSPIGRNLLASLGLGAPLIGKLGQLDFALVKRQTDLSERIRAPRYPFEIDTAAARRGAAHYQLHCASCHEGPENESRLYAAAAVGTDARRAESFTQVQADRFNGFLRDLESPGYQPSQEPGLRSTQKYFAASMAGVWARSPYLHNGSVRTMQELLTPSSARAKSFQRGSRAYDTAQMGYTDEGAYRFDTTTPGNSNAGHDYGTELSGPQRRELIQYLKTL